MKKIMLKVLPLFLSFVFVLSFAAVPVSGEEATVDFKLYAVNFGNEALSEIKSSNPLEIWLGGGKSSYKVEGTGITYDADGKTATLCLIGYFGGSSIDLTKGKNYFWLVANADSKGKTTTAKPKNANDYISVSAGKVTAKKNPTAQNNPAYIGIYTYDKATKLYTCHEVFPVIVKQAPAKLQAYSVENSIANADRISNITVGLNEVSQTVYVNPLTSKNVKTGISIDSLSYKIEVSNKNAAIVYKNENGDEVEAAAGETVLMDADSSGVASFKIKGLVITKDKTNAMGSALRQDKTATSAITVTNMQSGKSFKLTATIGNNVTEVAKLDTNGLTVIPLSATDSGGFSVELSTYAAVSQLDTMTIDLQASNLVKLNASDGTVTTAPTIGVYKAKSDGCYTYEDFVDLKKNKISFPTTDKSDDISITLAGKDNYHVKISAKKKADYPEELIQYAVIAYGTTEDTVLIIPVKISSPLDELRSIKIGTSSYAVSGEGVQSDAIRLTTGISNGISFSTESNLGLAPSITLTNGASYSTATKKLKLDDSKQTIMKLVYGINEYYYTIYGRNYAPKPLKTVKVYGTGEDGYEYGEDEYSLNKTISADDIDEGIKIEFTLSDGTKINPFSSELKFNGNGSEAVFDREKSTLTDFSAGDVLEFIVTLYNVDGTGSSKVYTITFTVEASATP